MATFRRRLGFHGVEVAYAVHSDGKTQPHFGVVQRSSARSRRVRIAGAFTLHPGHATLYGVALVVHGEFEWDSEKAKRNLRQHGVGFPDACTVFEDPFGVDAPDFVDPRRFVLIGMSRTLRVLYVEGTVCCGR